MSIFSKVSLKRPQSSTFNLSHERKFTCEMGIATPSLCMEVVPGDFFSMSSQQIVRFQPLVTPIMHEISVTNHYFFVPNRILWSGFEEFMTGGKTGNSLKVAPYFLNVSRANFGAGSLSDFLGVPIPNNVAGDNTTKISALPYAAYLAIWNDYYRDQNLQDEVDYKLNDGDNSGSFSSFYGLRRRAWGHDYFTSALPFAQRGNPVKIPLAGEITLEYEANVDNSVVKDYLGNPVTSGSIKAGPDGVLQSNLGASLNIDNSSNLKADLQNATSTTITDLRRAFRLQEFLERSARAGSRFTEFLLAHFGVHNGDARLDRPEFIGGSTSPVMVSEVLQTSETATSPQGNMAGHALNLGSSKGMNYKVTEHGFIMCITTVRPKTAYQQGLPKMFSRFDRFDYFFPTFENIGEQAILNKELFWSDKADDNMVFGYIPRYAEYKFMNNSVHGDFKTSLDFWHLGRIFENAPNLNAEFIQCKPSTRVFAVENSPEDQILIQLRHNINARRPMQYFGNPSF